MPLPEILHAPAPEIPPSPPRTFHRCYVVIPSIGHSIVAAHLPRPLRQLAPRKQRKFHFQPSNDRATTRRPVCPQCATAEAPRPAQAGGPSIHGSTQAALPLPSSPSSAQGSLLGLSVNRASATAPFHPWPRRGEILSLRASSADPQTASATMTPFHPWRPSIQRFVPPAPQLLPPCPIPVGAILSSKSSPSESDLCSHPCSMLKSFRGERHRRRRDSR